MEETYKRFIWIGATFIKEMMNIKREQNSIKFIINMFVDLEQSLPNKKKRLSKVRPLYINYIL